MWRLLGELKKVDWAKPDRPSEDAIKGWSEATRLMNECLELVYRHDFAAFGGKRDHLVTFLNDLVDGPDNQKLENNEFALLETYLEYPSSSEHDRPGDSFTLFPVAPHAANKLRFICNYNRTLRKAANVEAAMDQETVTSLRSGSQELKPALKDVQQSVHEEATSGVQRPSPLDHNDPTTIIVKRGHGEKEFNNSVSIRALIKASEKPGKNIAVQKRTFEDLKRNLRTRLGEDGDKIAKSLAFRKGHMHVRKDAGIKLQFVDFPKE